MKKARLSATAELWLGPSYPWPVIASTGQTVAHTPQSMRSAGWM